MGTCQLENCKKSLLSHRIGNVVRQRALASAGCYGTATVRLSCACEGLVPCHAMHAHGWVALARAGSQKTQVVLNDEY